MLWVDYREPLQPGNLTEYRISGNEMIHQLLIPQFQPYCKLKRIQGTKTRVERIALDQRLGNSKFPLADGEDLKFSNGDVSLKLA